MFTGLWCLVLSCWHKNYCNLLLRSKNWMGWHSIENWKQDVLWQWMCFRCSPIFPVYFPNGVLELLDIKGKILTSRTNRTFSCNSEKHMSKCIYSGRWNVQYWVAGRFAGIWWNVLLPAVLPARQDQNEVGDFKKVLGPCMYIQYHLYEQRELLLENEKS